MLLMPETLELYRDQIRTALEEGNPSGAAAIAPKLSSARIAKLLGEGPKESLVPFLLALEPKRAGRVVAQLPPEMAADMLEDMEQADAVQLFAEVPADHAADIVEVMDHHDHDFTQSLIKAAKRDDLAELVNYPRSSAGGVMVPTYVAISKGQTVGKTLDALISAPPEVERTSYVYVVDHGKKPVGVLSVKDLMRFDPQTRVEEAMNPDVVAVHVDDSAADAARLIRNRRFTMLPVLDANDAIVGVVTFDDAMDILQEQVADQFASLGAGSIEESFFTPPLGAVKRRLPWMSANVFLNLGAVAVITGFEDTIATVAILAAFLPMITDMGGNVGIQSLSVAIRSIALGEVHLRDFWRAIRKELSVGVINGLALGTLFAIVAFFWQGNPIIGILAGIALGTNVLVAGVIGGVLPFLIKRLGKDPAMMTGPVLTTITDITGVSIYLGLCTIFLSSLLG
jgi:magnesium transporter